MPAKNVKRASLVVELRLSILIQLVAVGGMSGGFASGDTEREQSDPVRDTVSIVTPSTSGLLLPSAPSVFNAAVMASLVLLRMYLRAYLQAVCCPQ